MNLDLTEISFKQAVIDKDIANARIVDLSCQIQSASMELLRFREELSSLRGHEARNTENSGFSSEVIIQEQPSQLLANVSILPTGLLGKVTDLLRPRLSAHIEDICGQPYVTNRQITLSRADHRFFAVSGWVVPKGSPKGLQEVVIALVNSNAAHRAHERTTQRNDVAKHFGNPNYKKSGFQFALPMKEFLPGTYCVELCAKVEGKIARRRLFSVVLR